MLIKNILKPYYLLFAFSKIELHNPDFIKKKKKGSSSKEKKNV